MTNTEMLKEVIRQSGFKRKYIAEKLGITYAGLMKKIRNESEFKASEIKILCDLLNICEKERDSIFFCA